MKLSEFVLRYEGKKLDVDGAYGAQCVDLCKAWAQNVGVAVPMGNANRYYLNADGVNYWWCYNKPKTLPQPGDMIVFEQGSFGHVALVLAATLQQVIVLEQNVPLGSAIRRHIYNYETPKCVGILRPTRHG